MMHMVYRQISDVGLYDYRTIAQQRLLDTGNLVIDQLDLLESDIGDRFVKETLLTYLDKALVRNNKDTEVPRNPGKPEDNQSDQTTDGEATEECPESKVGKQGRRNDSRQRAEHAEN
jgi:hypothetical protein